MPKNIFYKHKIENLININKIVTIHYFEFDKNFKFKGETHDFWEIVYADKSEVICSGENNEIILKQGDILFHKPGEFHTIRANGITAPNVFVMSFECKSEAMRFFFEKHFTLSDNIKPFISTIISEAKETFSLPAFNPQMKKLLLLNNPNLGGQQMIRTSLEQLLILIMREQTNKKNSAELFVSKELLSGHIENLVISFLKENIYNKINLDDVCRKFNYGKTYICTEFKKRTGRTIFEFYISLKIDEAKKLIRERNHNFTQISDLLMFDTPAYFTNTFKKYTGMTPKQYSASVKA